MFKKIIMLMVAAQFPTIAHGLTYTVAKDGSGDYTTIGAALAVADGSFDCEVVVYPGVYQEADLLVRSGVVLRSAFGPTDAVIQTPPATGDPLIGVATDALVEGLTFSGDGAVWTGHHVVLGFRARLTGCVFEGFGHDTGFGSPAQARPAVSVASYNAEIVDCIFEDNGGRAIYIGDGANATIRGCRFEGNTGEYGGAIYAGGDQGTTISDSWFVANTTPGDGGAINSWDALSIDNCVFVRNLAARGGAIVSQHPISISSTVFDANEGTDGGGAIYVRAPQSSAIAEITGCTFNGNRAVESGLSVGGSSILATDGYSVVITGSILSSGYGPAIRSFSGSVFELSCVDIFGNSQGDWDGPIAAQLAESSNLSLDPFFCALEPGVTEDWTIRSDSPCAPGNHPASSACELMGAREVGCANTPTRDVSWGQVKSSFLEW